MHYFQVSKMKESCGWRPQSGNSLLLGLTIQGSSSFSIVAMCPFWKHRMNQRQSLLMQSPQAASDHPQATILAYPHHPSTNSLLPETFPSTPALVFKASFWSLFARNMFICCFFNLLNKKYLSDFHCSLNLQNVDLTSHFPPYGAALAMRHGLVCMVRYSWVWCSY